MNDKLVSVNHGQLVTDSRKVAEHFGKQHKDVLKAIDHLVAQNCATKDMFLEQTRARTCCFSRPATTRASPTGSATPVGS